jgi:hypothetical protein
VTSFKLFAVYNLAWNIVFQLLITHHHMLCTFGLFVSFAGTTGMDFSQHFAMQLLVPQRIDRQIDT